MAILRWIGLLVSLLLLPACGGSSTSSQTSPAQAGGSPTPAATAPKSPCAIFQKAEVDAVMGRPMDEGKASKGTASAEGCQYFVAGGGVGSFGIFIYRGTSVADARQAFGLLADPTWPAVPNLGDEARMNTANEIGNISVRKGSLAVSVSAVGAVPAPTEAILKDLASKALSRA